MTTDQRAAYVANLRALADLIEDHESLPLPYQHNELTYFIHDSIDKALALRDVMTDPTLTRDLTDPVFPARYDGHLAGLHARVHIAARVAFANPVTTTVLPALDPRLTETAFVTANSASAANA